MEKETVCECIYTGSTEPAIEAEHIFPKCIGGVGTLPVGYVADCVNSAFSKLELGFARQYPPVVISRMFSAPMGRKKHRNREKVGLMKDRDKIAVNCLAKVKGHDFVMHSALAEIKQAILTGKDIEKYATYAKGPNPIPESLRGFPDRVLLGERPHFTLFLQDDQGDLIAFIALFGTENPVAIKLGRFQERVEVDFYICDWEHKADYTMMGFVLKVCKYDEESEWE